MKVRKRYFIYCVVILILSTVIPNIVTNSKYFSSVNMESGVSIGAMIFNISQAEGEPNPYQLNKGEEITVRYKLSNKDINNNINKMDLKYFLKVVDSAGGEVLPIQYLVEDYQYIQVENVAKGYGEISLAYDGQTVDEKILNIKITCPQDYQGEENLNYKVKIIAEGISNSSFSAEEVADLNLHINEVQSQEPQLLNSQPEEQSNSATENTNNTTTNENTTANAVSNSTENQTNMEPAQNQEEAQTSETPQEDTNNTETNNSAPVQPETPEEPSSNISGENTGNE